MTSPFRSGRRSMYGVSQKVPKPPRIVEDVIPQLGYSDIPDRRTQPGSILSGQNVWVRPGAWEPRSGQSQLGSNNILADEGVGTLTYNNIAGTQYSVIASKGTIGFLDGDTWAALTHQPSDSSNLPLAGGDDDNIFGTTVYLPRSDLNILAFTNGVDPVYAWDGPESSTSYSLLTGAPIVKDLTTFDNRLVTWNVTDLSNLSQLVQRTQWCVRGDIEDWTGIGSGFEDLLDMRGEGTRIFAEESEYLLFSTEEVWRGRKIGLPFVFQHTPLDREKGMPYPRAAIQTQLGIFWLGRDFLVWNLSGGRIQQAGTDIQRTLERILKDPGRAYFTWNGNRQHLTLHFTTTVGGDINQAYTLYVPSGQWTRHAHTFEGTTGSSDLPTTTSSAVTWGGLVGTFAAQTLTYARMLSASGGQRVDGAISSNGTVYALHPSATSDAGTAISQEITIRVLTDEPHRVKVVDMIRLQAGGGSTVSIGLSGDLGQTVPAETTVTLAEVPETSHQAVRPGAVSGVMPAVRLRTESTDTWISAGFQVEAVVRGPAV